MLKKEALAIVGGLSAPSKMPCRGYSLPASHCHTGRKLAKIPGTTCHDCYALKGMYRFSNVQAALQRRLDSLSDPRWVEAMTTLITGMPYFRWHDSGDIQSVAHLVQIARVAAATPTTKHWLPTRERAMLAEYRTAYGELPDNLVVRLSDTKINRPAAFKGIPVSGVHTTAPQQGHICPAPKQNGECRDCRACWDSAIERVSYHLH